MNTYSKPATMGVRRGAALILGALLASATIGCGRTSPPDGGLPAETGFVLPVPARGYISGRPASRWEESHISGNGAMGALVMGLPLDESIVLTHEKLFLPWEKPIPPVNTAARLLEIREFSPRDDSSKRRITSSIWRRPKVTAPSAGPIRSSRRSTSASGWKPGGPSGATAGQ